MIFPLGLMSLIQGLTELRKPIYSLEYWFILKATADQQGIRYVELGPEQRGFCPCRVWGLAQWHEEVSG